MGWIRHQLAVWRYGFGLLIGLAMWFVLIASVGGLLWLPLDWLFGMPFNGRVWAILTAVVAPFFLPDVAESLASAVRSDPPPRQFSRKPNRLT